MNCNPKFDDIRPYNEDEIPAAMQRIAACEFFPLLANFVFPDRPIEEVRTMVSGLTTTDEFQRKVMYIANKQIEARSIARLTFNGIDRLDPAKRYLFVSNHRDIMLDASLLQNVLVDNGHPTSQITFGANLMRGETVIDVGKSNKMFRVERGGNMKDFYHSSMHLSQYIRYVITERNESVWIAQRNGRTKNGIDKTDQGIIKMFCMSHSDDKIEALSRLNIVPVSVSYEWESCDVLKALELYESQFTAYTKKPGEDLNSILTGIVQPKGRVHFEIGEPLTCEQLMPFQGLTNNEYHKQVAALLDDRINRGYRLFPNNYIAYDLRYGTKRFADRYTDEERCRFESHLDKLSHYDTCDLEQLCDIFLGIYSNPVKAIDR